MGNCAGRSKTVTKKAPAVSVSEIDTAKLEIQLARDDITRSIKKNEATAAKFHEEATRLAQSGDRDHAKLLLIRRKIVLQTVSQAQQAQLTLDKALIDIENAEMQRATIESLKVCRDTTKSIMASTLSPDEVADLMEENRQLNADVAEINQLLHELPAGAEDELENELEALEAEMLADELDKVGPVAVGGTVAANGAYQAVEESDEVQEREARPVKRQAVAV